jgi:transcriptional regulator with XRE-family HTH domain
MDAIQRFAMNMKRTRKINNISQDELAHRSGLHRTYIGSVERGERNLTLRNAEVIAKALSTTLAALVSND